MQENSAEPSSKFSRSLENAIEQPSTNPAQFTRASCKPRFVVTPQSIGMTFATKKIQQIEQQAQQERLVDHNPESNASYCNSFSNTHANFYDSSKRDNIGQDISWNSKSPSPIISTKTVLQQWNLENNMKTDCTQQKMKIPSDNNNAVESPKSLSQLNKSFGGCLAATNTTPPCQCLQNIATGFDLLTCHQEQLLKCRSGSDASTDNPAKLNFKHINDIYVERIQDIDTYAGGHKDMKIRYYKEWVDILTKISESFISNMDELEKEVAGRLEFMQKRVSSGNFRQNQGTNDVTKYRKDIATLLKYIRNARNSNKWDLQGLTFETITADQVLDMGELDALTIESIETDEIKNFNDGDILQKNKLYANIKALAHEVAQKHDEVRELKRQVTCMEDEIQKAQQKIQLKDDVIKELRNDLKCANNNKPCDNQFMDPSLTLPAINFENQTSRTANTQITDNALGLKIDNSSEFDFLSHTELEEEQTIKHLAEEIFELCEINKGLNKNMEHQRQKIRQIIGKLESEKAAAYQTLKLIRRQLIDIIESDSIETNNDSDSGFNSKNENDEYAKLLDAIRKRLNKLNEMNCELKSRIQRLELHKNELSNNLLWEKSSSQRNKEILKQLADLLCAMNCDQFSQTEVYNTSPSKMNPFCEAIIEMQKEFQEKEHQLMQLLKDKHFNEENENKPNSFKDNDNTPTATTTTTLLSISSQPLAVTVSTSTGPSSQTPPISSTSLTDQQLNRPIATSLQGLVKK